MSPIDTGKLGDGGRYFVDGAGLRWRSDVQALTYRIGSVEFGAAKLRSFTLVTSFLNVKEPVSPPIEKLRSKQCDALVCPALSVERELPRLSLKKAHLIYVPRHEDRYFIKMEGSSFETYMNAVFSAKSRNTLRRHVRRYADAAGGLVDWRVYESVEEIREFRELALSISRRTYQHAEGVGLSESEEFAQDMKSEAAAGRARGYLLFFNGRPAAFAYCTLDRGVLLYAVVGYEPDLRERSPGRILLFEMIEALFQEEAIKYLDFGMEEYGYKSFFATDHVRCARVFYFPWSLRSLLIVFAHMFVLDLWRAASFCLRLVRGLRAKIKAPALPPQSPAPAPAGNE